MIRVHDGLPYVNLAVQCDSVTLKVAPAIASALHNRKDTPLMYFILVSFILDVQISVWKEMQPNKFNFSECMQGALNLSPKSSPGTNDIDFLQQLYSCIS